MDKSNNGFVSENEFIAGWLALSKTDSSILDRLAKFKYIKTTKDQVGTTETDDNKE